MIVPIEPPLQGIAIDRFHALAKALTHARQRNHEGDLQTLLAEDVAWARAPISIRKPTRSLPMKQQRGCWSIWCAWVGKFVKKAMASNWWRNNHALAG
ncbi:hypothetical protein BN874_990003 [Candidatus Contendobacter odensis Run_B_J11]|uniref:Uncharacterized protein n=1 Tax=Candidatus Contendobacter odensis Run_B_J11 TaxID=1400861 RepID=A0A7U7J6D2_9GAMM|nr:hypothetical protein BN874_990003 [Candidatus Contendobacter odensis Run_B_J11]